MAVVNLKVNLAEISAFLDVFHLHVPIGPPVADGLVGIAEHFDKQVSRFVPIN